MGEQSLTRDLTEVMESLRRTLEAKKEAATLEQPHGGKVIQLPLWLEHTKGTPNSFLRSALFAAIQGKERQAFKRELLAAQKGTTIRFTGWQLDQSNLDPWEQTPTSRGATSQSMNVISASMPFCARLAGPPA